MRIHWKKQSNNMPLTGGRSVHHLRRSDLLRMSDHTLRDIGILEEVQHLKEMY